MFKNSRDLQKTQGGKGQIRIDWDEVSVSPPSIDKGVQFSIDWLTITIWCDVKEALKIYEKYFREILGVLQDKRSGGFGYESRFEGLNGVALYFKVGLDRVTLKLPGKACQAIEQERFIAFRKGLDQRGISFNFTRLDLAFDNVPFTPEDINKAILDGQIRSLAHRDSQRFDSSQMKEREDGSGIGCSTCYLGSRKSGRMLRIYNKRGPTRLELETHGERADLVARQLFESKTENWFRVAISHVQDFIEVYKEYWKAFVGSVVRAYAKIVDIRKVKIVRMVEWLNKQVVTTLSMVEECYPGIVNMMLEHGRSKQNPVQRNLVLEFKRSL
jgi:DNA relaxase NicK